VLDFGWALQSSFQLRSHAGQLRQNWGQRWQPPQQIQRFQRSVLDNVGCSGLADSCGLSPSAIALADSEQNIGRSFWFALEQYVTNYTYFG